MLRNSLPGLTAFTLLSLIAGVPAMVWGAGLVTCEGHFCQTCHFSSTVNGLVKWLIGIVSALTTIVIMYSGFQMVTAAGNTGQIESAKEHLTNGILGLLILLSSWLIIDTILKVLLVGNQEGVAGAARIPDYGPWNEIECSTSPNATPVQGTNNSTVTSSSGGVAGVASSILDEASAMKAAGCIYDQARRNGCTGNPGYTDCSNLVETIYKKNGCKSPGPNTLTQYARATPIGDKTALRPGDSIVYNTGGAGHIGICQDNGCRTVIHAAGTGKGIVVSNSSWMLNRGDIRVIRAADYCP